MSACSGTREKTLTLTIYVTYLIVSFVVRLSSLAERVRHGVLIAANMGLNFPTIDQMKLIKIKVTQ